MITLDELKHRSGQLGVDITILEKDYCLGWFLKGFSENSLLHEKLAFKGATAIKKTYFPHYRFSEDLDFTSKKDFTEEILAEKLRTILERGYPRDIYDVWFVLKNGRVNDKLSRNPFFQKYSYKNVSVQSRHALLEKINAPHIKTHWEASLGRQLTNPPDLLTVKGDLGRILKKLLPS